MLHVEVLLLNFEYYYQVHLMMRIWYFNLLQCYKANSKILFCSNQSHFSNLLQRLRKL